MLIWLDGDTNTKAKPQENFGRELMELFTRGVGYYTEDDVYAAARVFTGWNLSRPATADRSDPSHSSSSTTRTSTRPARRRSASRSTATAASTIPSRVGVGRRCRTGSISSTRSSTHPETARRLATKLYAFFVSETAIRRIRHSSTTLRPSTLQNGTVIKPVLQRLFTSPQFQDPSIFFTRYAWPVEYRRARR